MASATCEIYFGIKLSAEPGTTNSQTCALVVGFPVAASPVAWAGNEGSRNVSDWLPKITEDFFDPRTGKVSARWYKFFRELSDRLGGVQGPSVVQIASSVSETQIQVAANTNYTSQAVAYSASVAASAEATAQVAQANGLSGSGSIPDIGDPPVRPGHQAL